MKKTFKKIGKIFIPLRQEKECIVGQSILIVDNGYSWIGQLSRAIERIKFYFPKAELSVLTFEQRMSVLNNDFHGLNYIIPSEELKPRRYRLALQMLNLRRRKFDFVILTSLDITPLIVSLLFPDSKVVLYNQWSQWWTLRLKNISEVLKITYTKKKTRFNFRNLLKRIGLFFVLLQRQDEEALRHSILLVDDGYASFGQLECAIQRARQSLPRAKISILGLEHRQELRERFSELEFIKAGRCIIERYRIFRHMLRLRNNKYDYVIILSLDITPIIASILFIKGKTLLFNKWHHWWSLSPRPIRDYFMLLPRFIMNIVIFIYLLIAVSWIFLKRTLNVLRFSLFKRAFT